MDYTLERKVDGEWYEWGTYNSNSLSEMNAMVKAAYEFGACETEVRVVQK